MGRIAIRYIPKGVDRLNFFFAELLRAENSPQPLTRRLTSILQASKRLTQQSDCFIREATAMLTGICLQLFLQAVIDAAQQQITHSRLPLISMIS